MPSATGTTNKQTKSEKLEKHQEQADTNEAEESMIEVVAARTTYKQFFRYIELIA